MSNEPREIELKLEVAPGDVPALRSGLMARFAGEGETTRLVSVYYDTPDEALRAAGVSLRVRFAGEAVIQTVKQARGAGAGLFDRDEWEVELAAREPDLEAFAATPAGARLAVAPSRLAPVFETRIDRTRWTVKAGRSAIEVALDNGRVVAGRRTEPFAEIELELKRGQPRDLFRLVHDLEDVGSLKPGVEVKSARGYRLARGKPNKPVKAEPVQVTRDMTAAAAFQAIVHGCMSHFGLNEPIVCRKRSPEALHQARVALRRLRSALSLFADMVADREYPRLKLALQSISRELGDARNLDVYLAGSARLEAEQQSGEPGLKAFLTEMEARRTAAYDRVVERLRSRAFNGVMLHLLEWVEAGPWLRDDDPLRVAARRRPARVMAAALLRRQRRKVKRKGRDLAALDPHARHRVRIDAKKLRYAAEFFASLVRSRKRAERHAAFLVALEDLQDHLGRLNDIETGDEIARSFTSAQAGAEPVNTSGVFAAAHVSGRQDADIADLVSAAEAAHRRLVETKTFWSGWEA